MADMIKCPGCGTYRAATLVTCRGCGATVAEAMGASAARTRAEPTARKPQPRVRTAKPNHAKQTEETDGESIIQSTIRFKADYNQREDG